MPRKVKYNIILITFMKNFELAWLIRRHAVEMTHLSGGSHLGSILSCADIIATLYSDILKYDVINPKWDGRDYFVLSKGHAGAGLYAALAEVGFFDKKLLTTHYKNGSILSGHVSHKTVPGVDASTGSLGHGLSYCVGIAYALKKDKKQNKVFCLVGDGECQEGEVYEAMILASQLKLANLFVLIDYNKMQAMGNVEDIISLEPFATRIQSLGFEVCEVNGNDCNEIKEAILNFKEKNKPHAIICNTVKGKGISFMEMNLLWHYRYPHDGEEYDNALIELEKQRPNGILDPYSKEK